MHHCACVRARVQEYFQSAGDRKTLAQMYSNTTRQEAQWMVPGHFMVGIGLLGLGLSFDVLRKTLGTIQVA